MTPSVLGGELFQPLDEGGAGGQALQQGVHEAGVPQVSESAEARLDVSQWGLLTIIRSREARSTGKHNPHQQSSECCSHALKMPLGASPGPLEFSLDNDPTIQVTPLPSPPAPPTPP